MTKLAKRWQALPTQQKWSLGFFGLFSSVLVTSLALNVLELRSRWSDVGLGPAIPLVGMAQPSPKRVQYRNQVQVNATEGAVVATPHEGYADAVMDVTLTIEPGETESWYPVEDWVNDGERDSYIVWVFAKSEPKGAKYWAIGGVDPPQPGDVYSIAPQVYVPEVQNFPVYVQNPSAVTIKVYLKVGVNLVEAGGGGDL